MDHNRFNAYSIMWLFVFFDLPVGTKLERKKAARFRKDLEKDGFVMMQYSVYTRHCASAESADVHERRVRGFTPDHGQVSILRITDKQYGGIINIWGAIERPLADKPMQLELF